LDQHGTSPELIERWLSPAFKEAVFKAICVATGEALPEPRAFDGYILSGSEKGVYDHVDWIEPLKSFLRQLRKAEIPVFGICFGHQIMAEAYGGKAVKADKGFVVGVRQYTQLGRSYTAHAMHRDQVVEVPNSATITATSSYCPVAALDYDFPARSVQFHPEFQHPFVNDAIDDFEGSELDSTEASLARISMRDSSVETSLYAQEIADFFSHARQAT
jgi:GMP synthase-like glutamine amidotransferase